MCTTLLNLYQSDNQNQKMVLREKLSNTKMIESNIVASYLISIQQVRDEIGANGVALLDDELVGTTLSGFSKPWATFVAVILARKKLPIEIQLENLAPIPSALRT